MWLKYSFRFADLIFEILFEIRKVFIFDITLIRVLNRFVRFVNMLEFVDGYSVPDFQIIVRLFTVHICDACYS